MTAVEIVPDCRRAEGVSQQRRFDRIAITSVFGDPRNYRTWSGAPHNLASALERQGVIVEGVHFLLGRPAKIVFGARHLIAGFGRLMTTEQILRGAPARRTHAKQVAAVVAQRGIRHVLHTGTLDLPTFDLLRGVRHYLYCDQTWALSLAYRPDARLYSAGAREEFERLEYESLASLEHVFTFGSYVRNNMIDHYGLPPDRVTVVGSGMGGIEPYFGPKDYSKPTLLFVAKHLFKAKGGCLLIEAFLLAQRQRPDLRLTIVGDERSRVFVPEHPQITFRAHLPQEALQQLYREASLLVQPMLNDPWGQVYLEALVSRTPVLGLNRNGLPEIIEGGRHGFLVDEPEPRLIADAIVAASDDPARLAEMGSSGQAHVLNTYSWDRVAERIAFI